jgi:phenylalanyl-tRNA synthetase beta chain
MKVSELWLREWVNPSLTGPQLVAQLTMAGLEVDSWHPVAGDFDHVVVAHVVQTKPHPQADKLTLCEVDAGTGSLLNIVCGAANVRAGLKVALALPGAHLPGNIHIKESMLRGQLSQGMLCSVSELGLEESSDGIIELAEDALVGTDLRDYLMLNDRVLDIDLTPNRADCFSVLGVAREVAALNNLSMRSFSPVINEPTIDDVVAVDLNAPEACPQYCGRIISGINSNAITPLWMKERLRRSGVRSIHPVVDVTNYVMLELGQPMHAFDYQTIEKNITVRFAHKNEVLVLLDGQEITLNDNVLVIADNEKALAMAGVMGGEFSAVQDSTTDIFLESAFFNPLVVAGVARKYGLFTDSSQRFERGVDPTLQAIALERATELLLSIVGGKAGPITMVTKSTLPAKVTVLFNPSKVKQLTGVEIPEDFMRQCLKNLGMTVDCKQDNWVVGVPSHRFDIALDVDLVEEVIRLYGYDNIKAKPLLATMQAGQPNSHEQLSRKITAFLSSRGYHETINYSFVDPVLQQELYPDTPFMKLLNPISSELSVMRVGMWPGLLAAMIYNMNRQQPAIKLFESGVVFEGRGADLKEMSCVAGLLTGEYGELNWSEASGVFDFYDMKGDLQSLFAGLNLHNIEFVPSENPALHPGKTAHILSDETEIGWLGVLHPRLMEELQITHEVMLFELSLNGLINRKSARYQSISKYPQVRRDLSLLVNKYVQGGRIEKAVREVVAAEWLKSFDIFDVYTGEGIPVDKKSLAIALILQDDNRTLVDTEINAIISAIINKLEHEFAIILRD